MRLPGGWAEATIGELIGSAGIFVDGDWIETKDQDQAGDVRLIQLADIGDGAFLNRSHRFLNLPTANRLGCTFLQEGDLLVARMPDPLGRAAIFPGDARKSVTAVDVCIIRAGRNGADHRWLMWTINSPAVRQCIAGLQSGTTRKRISRGNLATIKLPTPPSGEQERIVAEIEKQLTRLDAAMVALKRVQANLKRYRAAVLKAACEGRLVPTEAELARNEGRSYETSEQLLVRILKERRAKWGADQLAKMNTSGKPPKDDDWKKKYKEPAPPETASLPQLPEGWEWAAIGQLAGLDNNSITDGPFGSNLKTEHYTETGPRVVRLQNISDGVFRDAEAHISAKHYEKLRKHAVYRDDLVIAALGDPAPRACLLPEIGPAIVKADCIRFRPAKGVLSAFVMYALNSEDVRKRTKDRIHGVGRPRLNLQEIKEIVVPLPPATEQNKIVEELDRHWGAQARALEALTSNLSRGDRLRQSILKRAFEGKLVPQDPNDEPASVLLERIRAERATRATKEGNLRRQRQRRPMATTVT